VLRLKPGITGLAQINDIDMSDPARLAAWDDRYRAFRSLKADILILLRTVVGGGSGDRTAPATPETR
jgi:lipopolysaccharide/colanic/teichoic acid biosynthesis glycosyltransferase